MIFFRVIFSLTTIPQENIMEKDEVGVVVVIVRTEKKGVVVRGGRKQ